MVPDSWLIIAGVVLPPPGLVPLEQEKTLSASDASMSVQLNARGQAFGNCEALLASVDTRLKITAVKSPPPRISVIVHGVRLKLS
jgi:hypothetical protein